MAENKAICPDCGQTITVSGQIMVGWLVDCPNCDAELEIVETVPLELDIFYEDDESDDYEDDEDEDDEDEDDDDL